MPAKGQVSIGWQVILSIFIPYFVIYAFYRIMRLRKLLVILVIFCLIHVGLTSTSPTAGGFYDIKSMQDKDSEIFREDLISKIFTIVNGLVGAGVVLYYLWRWSSFGVKQSPQQGHFISMEWYDDYNKR